MWFPIHSKKCCTKQEVKFVKISFHLWMTIPSSCITSLPMTRYGVSCTTSKSMVSQLGDKSTHPCSARTGETQHCCVTTPAIFSKPVLFKLFFSYTSVIMPNMYMYQSVLQILMPNFRILVLQDVMLDGRFEVFKLANQHNKCTVKTSNFAVATLLI